MKKNHQLVDGFFIVLDLISLIINKFINSKYNRNVFYDVNHREYSDHIPNNVYCDVKGCEYNPPTILEGQKMYYCYDCSKKVFLNVEACYLL